MYTARYIIDPVTTERREPGIINYVLLFLMLILWNYDRNNFFNSGQSDIANIEPFSPPVGLFVEYVLRTTLILYSPGRPLATWILMPSTIWLEYFKPANPTGVMRMSSTVMPLQALNHLPL